MHVGVKLLYEHVRNLESFLHRVAHPQKLNASGREVSGKLDRMTWCSKWIAQSEKFSKRSSHAFSSQNRTKLQGAKEEEEEPRRIGFLEGTDFLGAMTRRLNERERERENKDREHN